MSERYFRVYDHPEIKAKQSSGIGLEAGALFFDCESGRVFALLKLRYEGERRLSAVKLCIACFDGEGARLPGKTEYIYSPVTLTEGLFGAERPILLPDETASFRVERIFAAFESPAEAPRTEDKESRFAGMSERELAAAWLLEERKRLEERRLAAAKSPEEAEALRQEAQQRAEEKARREAEQAAQREAEEAARREAEEAARREAEEAAQLKADEFLRRMAGKTALSKAENINSENKNIEAEKPSSEAGPETGDNTGDAPLADDGDKTGGDEEFTEHVPSPDSALSIPEEPDIEYPVQKRRKKLRILLCVILVLVLLAAAAAIIFLLPMLKGGSDSPAPAPVVTDTPGAAPALAPASPAPTDAPVVELEFGEYNTLAIGERHMIALRDDGSILSFADNSSGQLEVDTWTDVVSLAAGAEHSLGLKSDGTVFAAGDNQFNRGGVESWTDICAVYAGESCSIGVKGDSSIVVAGFIGLDRGGVAKHGGMRLP